VISVIVVVVAHAVLFLVFGQPHQVIDTNAIRRRRRRTAVRTTLDAGFRTVRRVRVGHTVHAVHPAIPHF